MTFSMTVPPMPAMSTTVERTRKKAPPSVWQHPEKQSAMESRILPQNECSTRRGIGSTLYRLIFPTSPRSADRAHAACEERASADSRQVCR